MHCIDWTSYGAEKRVKDREASEWKGCGRIHGLPSSVSYLGNVDMSTVRRHKHATANVHGLNGGLRGIYIGGGCSVSCSDPLERSDISLINLPDDNLESDLSYIDNSTNLVHNVSLLNSDDANALNEEPSKILRLGHSMHFVEDTKSLWIIGGYSPTAPLASRVMDIQCIRFELSPNLGTSQQVRVYHHSPAKRCYHASTLIHSLGRDYIVIYGGQHCPSRVSSNRWSRLLGDLWILQLPTDEDKYARWFRIEADVESEAVEVRPPSLVGASIVYHGNQLYLYGGFDGNRPYNELWTLANFVPNEIMHQSSNPVWHRISPSDGWISMTSLRAGRWGNSSILLSEDDLWVLAGGWGSNKTGAYGPIDDLLVLDLKYHQVQRVDILQDGIPFSLPLWGSISLSERSHGICEFMLVGGLLCLSEHTSNADIIIVKVKIDESSPIVAHVSTESTHGTVGEVVVLPTLLEAITRRRLTTTTAANTVDSFPPIEVDEQEAGTAKDNEIKILRKLLEENLELTKKIARSIVGYDVAESSSNGVQEMTLWSVGRNRRNSGKGSNGGKQSTEKPPEVIPRYGSDFKKHTDVVSVEHNYVIY
eukprot:GHVH01007651.1.p2 GENE.GHVH01007651.1~~GHVH01007651.1.p2  ORF type:complete len:592 (-),score=52.25 GHVH01007651.1:446-2221(-)